MSDPKHGISSEHSGPIHWVGPDRSVPRYRFSAGWLVLAVVFVIGGALIAWLVFENIVAFLDGINTRLCAGAAFTSNCPTHWTLDTTMTILVIAGGGLSILSLAVLCLRNYVRETDPDDRGRSQFLHTASVQILTLGLVALAAVLVMEIGVIGVFGRL